MSTSQRSTALYPNPFSRAYWRDAAAELKSIKMLVVTAFLIALRIALKPFAIYIGPQMAIQTATLATALGAMIYGPVLAIPAAMISDTIGFMIFPSGDYFLPFMLTEIASTMIYALCLYRAKPSALRVIIARFLICFFVNVVLQQLIFAWQYTYMGNPDKAKDAILGITTVARIFKNLFFFPIETVVITLFLKVLVPVATRVKLTYSTGDLRFTAKQIVALVLLVVVGIGSAIGYLTYRYEDTSRSADYTDEQRIEKNQLMIDLIEEESDLYDEGVFVTVVDAAKCPLFGPETTYEVSIYEIADGTSSAQIEECWTLSKSGPKKEPYSEFMTRVGTAVIVVKNADNSVISIEFSDVA